MSVNKLYQIVNEGGRQFIQKGRILIPVGSLEALGDPIPAVILDGIDNIDDLAKEGAREQGLLKDDRLGRANTYKSVKIKLRTHPRGDYDTAVAITLYHAEPLLPQFPIGDE